MRAASDGPASWGHFYDPARILGGQLHSVHWLSFTFLATTFNSQPHQTIAVICFTLPYLSPSMVYVKIVLISTHWLDPPSGELLLFQAPNISNIYSSYPHKMVLWFDTCPEALWLTVKADRSVLKHGLKILDSFLLRGGSVFLPLESRWCDCKTHSQRKCCPAHFALRP